jgi:hypothetical protein
VNRGLAGGKSMNSKEARREEALHDMRLKTIRVIEEILQKMEGAAPAVQLWLLDQVKDHVIQQAKNNPSFVCKIVTVEALDLLAIARKEIIDAAT